MKKIIAYCGLVCSDCPAYLATQADDRQELERVAAFWRVQFSAPQITADSIVCDGCLPNAKGRLSGYCSICKIRACAEKRELKNCAYCPDYGCETLRVFLEPNPHAKALLDSIRKDM
jgi:hypothetical protein